MGEELKAATMEGRAVVALAIEQRAGIGRGKEGGERRRGGDAVKKP